jgi:hypothetical protein
MLVSDIVDQSKTLTTASFFSYNLVDRNPYMSRKIGERKFIVNQISSIFKFYEATFLDLEFDWIESHARSAKLMKSATNSGIVKVDSKATRYSDGLDVWHMEVSGGPSNATDIHTVGDTIKTLRMDVLNLIRVLRNHLMAISSQKSCFFLFGVA